MLNRPSALALAVVALTLLAQAAVVYGEYGGSLTALFYVGAEVEFPADQEAAGIYRFSDPIGFDGQYYLMVAGDPLLAGQAKALIDNPPLRWRRILLPGLAWALGLGQTAWIPFAYVVLTAGFLGLGVWQLGCKLAQYALPPAGSLLLLALPAAYVSLERMTVDMALLGLTAAFLLHSRDERFGPALALLLTAAPFARETGVLLALAAAAAFALRRNFVAAAGAAATLVPYAGWVAWVRVQTWADSTPWLVDYPFSGLLRRTLEPFPYALSNFWVSVAGCTDYLAVLGVWAALAATVRLALRRDSSSAAWLAYGFAATVAVMGKADIWGQTYAFGRILSPWLLVLALKSLQRREPLLGLPAAAPVPRLAWQAATHLQPTIRGLLGG